MNYSLLGFSSLKGLFNIHPMFVHFPVALFPSALLLYLVGMMFKKNSLNVAGRACLYLAFAGTLAAVGTGLGAQDTFPHNETIHRLMQTHKSLGIALLIIGAILIGWSFWQVDHAPKGKWGFLAVLAFAVYLVSQSAEIGGRMVYLEGAAVKPAVSAIAEKDDSEESKKPTEAGEHRQIQNKVETDDHSGHQHSH